MSKRVIVISLLLIVTVAAVAEYLFFSGPASVGPTTKTSSKSETSNGISLTSKGNRSVAGDDIFPTWSPDGSKLLFLRLTRGNNAFGVGNESIWVLYLNGTERGPILEVDTSATLITGATWSPDGVDLIIATASYGSLFGSLTGVSRSDLFSFNLKASSVRTLTTVENSSIIDPVQLVDGSIVFLSGASASLLPDHLHSLYVIGTDGTGPKKLLTGGSVQDISFCSNPGRTEVATVYETQSGTNLSVIVFPSRAITSFAWYADQAFCTWSANGSTIFTYSFSGSQKKVTFATTDASGKDRHVFGGQILRPEANSQSIFAQPLCQQLPPSGGSFPATLSYMDKFVLTNLTSRMAQGQAQAYLDFWQTDAMGIGRLSVLNASVPLGGAALLASANNPTSMIGCQPQYAMSYQREIAYDQPAADGYLELVVFVMA